MNGANYLLIIAEFDKLVVAKKQSNQILYKTRTYKSFKDADLLLLISKIFNPAKDKDLKGIFFSIEGQSFSSTRTLVSTVNTLALANNCRVLELPVAVPGSQINQLFNLGMSSLSKSKTQFIKPNYLNLPNITKPKIKVSTIHICAAGLVFNKTNQKILFIKRKDTGRIGLPKGHQELNENFFATAEREVIEETGYYDIRLLGRLNTVKYRFTVKGALQEKTEHRFLFLLNSLKAKNRLNSGEIRNLDNLWLKIDQALKDPNLYLDIKETIARAVFILKKRKLI
jgi:8-oxo-dGTP pyrophosphatase MutT (NUDIX family)